MASLSGSIVNETFGFDGGRRVTMYVPPGPRRSVVFAADGGWHTERLARALEASAEGPSTVVIGVHGLDDDDGRLHEYVESFGGERFEFEQFVAEEVHAWARSDWGVELPAERTGIWGASSGGEFALAMGLRHPAKFGSVLCASPGGGFTPTGRELPREVPRTYLVAVRRSNGSSTTRATGRTHSAMQVGTSSSNSATASTAECSGTKSSP